MSFFHPPRSGMQPLTGTAPVDTANVTAAQVDEDEEMPRVQITRRGALLFGFFVVSAIAFLYFVLPRLTGLSETWDRLHDGDPWWLGVAFVFEVCAFGGYVWLFRTVVSRGVGRIGWRETYQINMAGLAATRLFAAGGAGGIALTAWALRRAGMEARVVACRMAAFLVLLYSVYMTTLIIDGIGLRLGLFEGSAPFAMTVVPAIFGTIMFAIFLAVSFLPHDIEQRIERRAHGSGRLARWMTKAVSVPATVASGVRTAIALLRARELGVLGAVTWWAFDIGVLWASFHAFGSDTPTIAVIVMAYFVGMLGNTLPMPGGIGGVDGGMIGAFAAFGVPFGYATVAVLVYRGFSFWLPTLPGAIAYLQLRRTVNRWREERKAERLAAEPVGA